MNVLSPDVLIETSKFGSGNQDEAHSQKATTNVGHLLYASVTAFALGFLHSSVSRTYMSVPVLAYGTTYLGASVIYIFDYIGQGCFSINLVISFPFGGTNGGPKTPGISSQGRAGALRSYEWYTTRISGLGTRHVQQQLFVLITLGSLPTIISPLFAEYEFLLQGLSRVSCGLCNRAVKEKGSRITNVRKMISPRTSLPSKLCE